MDTAPEPGCFRVMKTIGLIGEMRSRFSRHLLNGLFTLATPLGAILFYAAASQQG